ncbi:hypothetical protein [Photobacterium sp. TY1-4]|uniref:hypothetical protein n=1 Tax=Photobacterium sp. TY1-4 TaxID=2899122 RepID=UPI0021BF171E|nr:hypothetical protein [Photobacterium sp. TY1-4]UXI00230.1 hypothetical protein NH461_10410 [Photobacterium sp. TY1-4]
MKKAFATIFALASLPGLSDASEFRATLPMASKHYYCASEQCLDLNESNPGFGVEYAGYGIVGYKNSYSRQSFVFYKAFEYDPYDYFGFGIRLGGVTGYEEESGLPVMPLAHPYLRLLPFDGLSFNLGAAPVGLIDTKNYNLVVTLDSQITF